MTKFEANWRNKCLENLEKDYWGIPENESYLVTTCHKLRKKPVEQFNIEDLRIMIGQSIGLKYLIPLAFEVLNSDFLSEGDFYEGDLLTSVLSSDISYWKVYTDNWQYMCELFQNNEEKLKTFDTTNTIKKQWFELFKIFENINTAHNNGYK